MLRYFNYLHFCLLVLVLCSFYNDKCNANDVLGCNGFIKSNVGDNDFSNVEIKMFTMQGSLKDQTECAPNSGYFFLPLYDKGDYILKVSPPVGWHFEPAQVAVHVDGVSDSCSLGIDINFVLQGFAVIGQVNSFGTPEGPKGVTVNLKSLSSPQETLLTTTTQDGGHFLLTPVKPGQYVIEITHERWHISSRMQKVAVTVTSGNTQVPAGSLEVAGYDVTGQVTSNGEPITSVSFILFQQPTAKRIAVVGCDSSALTGFTHKGLDLKDLVPLCHVSSNYKGRFMFIGLPPGHYTVVPHYKGTHSIKFDVHPQLLDFEVKHGSLELSTKFQVKGFSVSGQVLWSENGKPMEGATISLDGKMVSMSGDNGVFHLDSMTPGIYKLQIQAKNGEVMFDQQTVRVTPNSPHLGSMVPSSYRVCGQVTTSQTSSSPGGRFIDFTPNEGVPLQAVTGDKGEFCLFLPPGTYFANVPVSDNEIESGLQFAPLKKEVRVVDGPITGVDFSQLQATIRGKIKCLNSPCPETASVTLDSLTVLSKGGVYVFENVLPGEYTVSVPTEEFCWQTSKFPLVVSSEEVTGPTFIQTGLPIHFISSHSTKVQYKGEEKNEEKAGSVKEVQVNVGRSDICVAGAKVGNTYLLEPVGCHGYTNLPLRWVAGSQAPISLIAVTHQYAGRIISALPDPDTTSDLFISIIPSDENYASSSVRRIGPLKGRVADGNMEYEFSLQLAEGETVTLVPAASPLLFTPPSLQVVGGNDCVPASEGVLVRAERGTLMSGRVVSSAAAAGGAPPVPVSGATISVYDVTGHLVSSQLTDTDGRYFFGPLTSSSTYNVTAEKEGYVLTGPNAKGEFNAHKLAEVIVAVKDKANGSPLQGVLLSLSGGERYRRNSQTGADGSMAFLSLSPGEYYLRPIMKEYRFDPPSKVIHVQEGATVKITLSGSRVAYSVVGQVTTLGGDPELGVVVEAVGQGPAHCSQLQEESSSESNGQFRIRGLQPQCEYSVRMKQGPQINQHIQRSTPDGILVKVTNKDVEGLTIIVFRPITRTDVTVFVSADSPETLRSLRVRLARESDGATVHSTRLTSLKNMETVALVLPPVPADGRTYAVHLESSLSQKTHYYRTQPAYFKANCSFQVVRLHFEITSQLGGNELSQTSYFTLPLILIAMLSFYYRDWVQVAVTRLMENGLAGRNSDNGTLTDDSTANLIADQMTVKRKSKQRKT